MESREAAATVLAQVEARLPLLLRALGDEELGLIQRLFIGYSLLAAMNERAQLLGVFADG